jgi:protein-S-isoprenylcysteine O-methyltransferase Ste14
MPLLLAALVVLALRGPDMAGTEALAKALQVCGIALAVFGHAVRLWSVGHAGVTTRSLELNAPALATGGPYAYCRNPMYWGNFFIGLGVVLFAQLWWVLVVYTVVFWLEYYAIVRVEEAFLRAEFGREYTEYSRSVPRFRPRLTGFGGSSGKMDWSVLRGGEHQALVGTILMIAVIELAKHIHMLRTA